MKKPLSILICLLLLFGTVSPVCASKAAKSEALKITGLKYVVVGKTITLKANKAVKWKSDNDKIATVNSKGKVKGVKAGNVKITATAKEGTEKKTWNITVVKKAVSSITFSKSVSGMKVGESYTFKVKVKPNSAAQEVTWKSSNTKVATVSKGKVKALKAGKTTITATAMDGSKKYASITLKVEKKSGNPSPTPGRKIRIGLVNGDPDESGYRKRNVADFEKVFTEANGYELQKCYSFSVDKQIKAVQGFIEDKVDYLLISSSYSNGSEWTNVLTKAKKAGIPVILFDRMINCDVSLYEVAVVSSYQNQGDQAVAWLKKQNLSQYRVIHLQGAMGSDAQIGRSKALNSEFSSGSMKKIVQKSTDWMESEAKSIVESVIKSGESFNVIYAENDGIAKGAVAALDEYGITHGPNGKVVIISFDCCKWALRELLKGNWNYDGQCSPFQASTVKKMIETLEAGQSIQGLNAKKQYFMKEKGFDARTITEKDIETYGLD